MCQNVGGARCSVDELSYELPPESDPDPGLLLLAVLALLSLDVDRPDKDLTRARPADAVETLIALWTLDILQAASTHCPG